MTARLAPLAREELTEDALGALRHALGADAADALVGGGPDAPAVPSVLATLLRHPKLAGPFLAYNFVLLQQPSLEPRWRELIVLRVAWRTRAPYEWVQHVRLGSAAGVMQPEIDAIAGRADHHWPPFEADLLTATDELIDAYCISDATWQRLAAHLDERQLIELVFVAGTYTALAMVFNSIGLELDPDLEPIAAAVPMPDTDG